MAFAGEGVANRLAAFADTLRAPGDDLGDGESRASQPRLLRATPKSMPGSRRGRGAARSARGRGRRTRAATASAPRSRSRDLPDASRLSQPGGAAEEATPAGHLSEAQLAASAQNRAAAIFRHAQNSHRVAARMLPRRAGDEVHRQYVPLDSPPEVRGAIRGHCVRMSLEAHDANNRANPCICFEAFSAGEDALRLPCFHLFHHDCVARWFAADGHDVVMDGGFVLQHRMRCPFCYVSILRMMRT